MTKDKFNSKEATKSSRIRAIPLLNPLIPYRSIHESKLEKWRNELILREVRDLFWINKRNNRIT